jgi:hypothetical protein
MRRLQELAVHSAVDQLAAATLGNDSPAPAPRARRARDSSGPESASKAEPRRSARENKSTISYKVGVLCRGALCCFLVGSTRGTAAPAAWCPGAQEDDWFPDLPRLGGGPRGPRRVVDEEGVEELRRAHGAQAVDDDEGGYGAHCLGCIAKGPVEGWRVTGRPIHFKRMPMILHCVAVQRTRVAGGAVWTVGRAYGCRAGECTTPSTA